jgi:tripeptide aminopeptidase
MQQDSKKISTEIASFIRQDVCDRFVRYAQLSSASDPLSSTKPSTSRQHNLLSLLASELRALGAHNVAHAPNGFVYATLPENAPHVAFGLMAHVDTSPDQSGEGVKPLLRENYDGGTLSFPDDQSLTLSPDDSPELLDFIGDTIVTASGLTLLGADDKAGVAEIMAMLATFHTFPQLAHGRIEVCFTTDEEIGHGVDGIDTSRLPAHLYTMDGSYPGELETECFDAIGVTIEFRGRGVHPGFAYGKMINAALLASSFIAALPKNERPETTKGRDGFYHVSDITGNNEHATVRMIIRDFEHSRNLERLDYIRSIVLGIKKDNPGSYISVSDVHQYENMREVLEQHPEVIERAVRAINDAGLTVRRKAIRGGTDGSKLTAMGYPTPNIFAGGMLFHSKREWIALSSMVKAVETLLHLARHHTMG